MLNQVLRWTGSHVPSCLSSCNEWCALICPVIFEQNAALRQYRKALQNVWGGFGWYGHFKSDPACHSPLSKSAGTYVPLVSTKSAAVTTLKYIRTAFARLNIALDIPGIEVKASISD